MTELEDDLSPLKKNENEPFSPSRDNVIYYIFNELPEEHTQIMKVEIERNEELGEFYNSVVGWIKDKEKGFETAEDSIQTLRRSKENLIAIFREQFQREVAFKKYGISEKQRDFLANLYLNSRN